MFAKSLFYCCLMLVLWVIVEANNNPKSMAKAVESCRDRKIRQQYSSKKENKLHLVLFFDVSNNDVFSITLEGNTPSMISKDGSNIVQTIVDNLSSELKTVATITYETRPFPQKSNDLCDDITLTDSSTSYSPCSINIEKETRKQFERDMGKFKELGVLPVYIFVPLKTRPHKYTKKYSSFLKYLSKLYGFSLHSIKLGLPPTIAIRRELVGQKAMLLHEVGHALGLRHIFWEQSKKCELLEKITNSFTTGDFCEDTYPQPIVEGEAASKLVAQKKLKLPLTQDKLFSNCDFLPKTATVQINNYMSSAVTLKGLLNEVKVEVDFRTTFTKCQLERMRCYVDKMTDFLLEA